MAKMMLLVCISSSLAASSSSSSSKSVNLGCGPLEVSAIEFIIKNSHGSPVLACKYSRTILPYARNDSKKAYEVYDNRDTPSVSVIYNNRILASSVYRTTCVYNSLGEHVYSCNEILNEFFKKHHIYLVELFHNFIIVGYDGKYIAIFNKKTDTQVSTLSDIVYVGSIQSEMAFRDKASQIHILNKWGILIQDNKKDLTKFSDCNERPTHAGSIESGEKKLKDAKGKVYNNIISFRHEKGKIHTVHADGTAHMFNDEGLGFLLSKM